MNPRSQFAPCSKVPGPRCSLRTHPCLQRGSAGHLERHLPRDVPAGRPSQGCTKLSLTEKTQPPQTEPRPASLSLGPASGHTALSPPSLSGDSQVFGLFPKLTVLGSTPWAPRSPDPLHPDDPPQMFPSWCALLVYREPMLNQPLHAPPQAHLRLPQYLLG